MMDAFIASIMLFAGNFAPKGWAECKGQVMQISQNNALFALIGTTYGGNGSTTFALPNLKAPLEGTRYIICTQGIFPSRND